MAVQSEALQAEHAQTRRKPEPAAAAAAPVSGAKFFRPDHMDVSDSSDDVARALQQRIDSLTAELEAAKNVPVDEEEIPMDEHLKGLMASADGKRTLEGIPSEAADAFVGKLAELLASHPPPKKQRVHGQGQ